MAKDCDFLIIGGGFYGCCLALLLRSLSQNVIVVERGDAPLERASRVNQARIHAGFHYPRSFVTALRSKLLYKRFAADFPDAVVDDFQMVYAIARRKSKVTGQRFLRTFQEMGAPVSAAGPGVEALFSSDTIEDCFTCTEWAFDFRALRTQLTKQLDKAGLTIRFNTTVENLTNGEDSVIAELSDGNSIAAGHVFNVTYSHINNILLSSGLQALPMKHEWTEIALVQPPEELQPFGFTIMDGPFFSLMPYPAESRYSFTHVRYTPHFSWLDENVSKSPYEMAETLPRQSRWRHMVADAAKYMPGATRVTYEKSLFDVKTVLLKNERDDGRPILFHQHSDAPNVTSIMGGKLDNIYDLFAVLPQANPAWRDVNTSFLFDKPIKSDNPRQIHHVS
ncbi:FAD-binding oxidoreductase [Parvularcula sp. IMCC14364]|uniref:NAD(P)/FAD-dependent oxidoreductase n=1 Tax=Parvularcula sp. IMCC14364 TaxID=3067902 RepID=UPI00274196FE|nr:FAD-binding oxidoreductase [Parvularcula sp. IMCC14364]